MKAARVQPFFWNVRVYYEDTDAAGVVHYANYLKHLERARSEWPAATGVTLSGLESEHNAVFVVHHVEIDYRLPARLGDSLTVSLEPVERSRVRLVLSQDDRARPGMDCRLARRARVSEPADVAAEGHARLHSGQRSPHPYRGRIGAAAI